MGGRLEEGRPMERFGLHNDHWGRIKDVLPGREGHVGGTADDSRLLVEAVLYRFRTGCRPARKPAKVLLPRNVINLINALRQSIAAEKKPKAAAVSRAK